MRQHPQVIDHPSATHPVHLCHPWPSSSALCLFFGWIHSEPFSTPPTGLPWCWFCSSCGRSGGIEYWLPLLGAIPSTTTTIVELKWWCCAWLLGGDDSSRSDWVVGDGDWIWVTMTIAPRWREPNDNNWQSWCSSNTTLTSLDPDPTYSVLGLQHF